MTRNTTIFTTMQTPTQTPTQTTTHLVQTPPHTPPQVDWGELGTPPPPPVLIRQNAHNLNFFDIARTLDFDEVDENEGGFPLPLLGNR